MKTYKHVYLLVMTHKIIKYFKIVFVKQLDNKKTVILYSVISDIM